MFRLLKWKMLQTLLSNFLGEKKCYFLIPIFHYRGDLEPYSSESLARICLGPLDTLGEELPLDNDVRDGPAFDEVQALQTLSPVPPSGFPPSHVASAVIHRSECRLSGVASGQKNPWVEAGGPVTSHGAPSWIPASPPVPPVPVSALETASQTLLFMESRIRCGCSLSRWRQNRHFRW